MLRLAWSLLLIVACAGGATHVPAPQPRREVAVSDCSLERATLRCRWSARGERVLVARDAAGVAPRLGGGAFVLRRDGTLERWDRKGRLTGRVPTALESLVAAGPYVCGSAWDGVACFRDAHEDLACARARFDPRPEPVAAPADAASVGDGRRPVLRAGRDLLRIGGTCGQHCLRLGCDGPRRCLDPCPPGRAPRLVAEPLGEPPARFLSKGRTAGVTHPL